jgi:hypothetical protein
MSRNHRRRRPASVDVGGQRVNPAAMTPDPNFKPVDLSMAKEGWRAWQVSTQMPAFGLAPKLHSVAHTYHWAPKRKAEAACNLCEETEGVPGVECSCGFYSAKSLQHLMKMGYHLYNDIDETKQFKIVGQVACWGKVIEGTQGWRSQFCYPTYLIIPFEMGAQFGARIRDAYGCKVRIMNFLKQPHEITDEFVQSLLDGKPQLQAMTRPTRQGRRVAHRQLKFVGRATSDAYERDGKKLIDVIWDVTPEKTVAIQVEHLAFEAH